MSESVSEIVVQTNGVKWIKIGSSYVQIIFSVYHTLRSTHLKSVKFDWNKMFSMTIVHCHTSRICLQKLTWFDSIYIHLFEDLIFAQMNFWMPLLGDIVATSYLIGFKPTSSRISECHKLSSLQHSDLEILNFALNYSFELCVNLKGSFLLVLEWVRTECSLNDCIFHLMITSWRIELIPELICHPVVSLFTLIWVLS